MQRFILIAVLALVAFANANSNLIVGYKESGEELLEQKEVSKHWLPWTVVEKDLTVASDGKHRITRVEAHDLSDTNSKAKIISGGPGESYVTLKFESSRGNKINYLVKVYGKRI